MSVTKCALVNCVTHTIVNLVMADPEVDSWEGHKLIPDPPEWLHIGMQEDAKQPGGAPKAEGLDTL